jgi:DNA-directed RNA polymerase beta' subunit
MGENQRAFVRALHESTAIADRIREAIADAPPELVMLALSDLLQEHLTRLVEAGRGRQPPLPKVLS